MASRLKVVYAIDAVGRECAGGLRAGLRVVDALRERHEVVLLGVGEPAEGLVRLEPMKVPVVTAVVARNQFTFARPDDARIRRALDGADLLHVQLPFFLGHRAMALARQAGIPVVVSHHVQPENFLYNVGLHWPWLAGALNRALVHSFYDRADAVVCPTEFSLRELLRAGLSAPSFVISNGAPPEFRTAPKPEPREGLSLLTVGRMAREKRQAVVVEAVLHSRHRAWLKLVVAGRGPLEERLKRRAAALGGSARVGFVPDGELLRLYQHSDVYLHASEVELEGLSVLEAARCGCPALISDSPFSAAPAFAADSGWLFAPGDAKGLAERLDHLVEHPWEVARARQRVLQLTARHTLERSVRQLEQLYWRVVAHEVEGARPAPPMLQASAH